MLFSNCPNNILLSRLFVMIFNKSQSPFKRYGRLLNKEASEPGGTEAIVFLGECVCLGMLIQYDRKAI